MAGSNEGLANLVTPVPAVSSTKLGEREFLLVFYDGNFSEYETVLLTGWIGAHAA